MDLRRLALGVSVVAVLAAGSATWAVIVSREPPPVTQPLAFSHARHAAEGIACADCHAGAATGPHATLPPLEGCLLCHGEALGTHPDEPRLRAHAERGEPIPWVGVNRLPGHVHFSHAAHVTGAGMGCAECHGDVAARTEPLTRPQIGHLDMAACERCHAARAANLDCLACHQ